MPSSLFHVPWGRLYSEGAALLANAWPINSSSLCLTLILFLSMVAAWMHAKHTRCGTMGAIESWSFCSGQVMVYWHSVQDDRQCPHCRWEGHARALHMTVICNVPIGYFFFANLSCDGIHSTPRKNHAGGGNGVDVSH